MSRGQIQAGKAVIVVDVVDKATAGFQQIQNKILSISRGLRNLGTGAAGGALLSGLGVRKVISNFIEFEDKILNLSAKLGYFGIATRQQKAIMDDLTKTIINLGKATSYTSAEVADAAVSLAQAGFSASEIKASLAPVLDLARGTGYALGEAADMAANAIRTFKLFGQNDSLQTRMQKTNQLVSMFVKATRLGTIEIEDLRESLKYSSGAARNLGVELPVVLGFLVQVSEAGMKASLAGTSMNTAMYNMIRNSKALKEALPNFRVFTDSKGNMDMVATLGALYKQTAKFDKLSRATLFQDIFNLRGQRFVAGADDLKRVEHFIKQIATAGDEGRQAAAKMESGLGGALRRATSAVEALNIAMGFLFNEQGKAALNFFTVMIDGIEKVVAKYKGFVGLLILSPAILGAVAVGSLTLSFAFARLYTATRMLAGGFKIMKSVGGVMGGGLMSLANPVKAFKANRTAAFAQYAKQQAKVAKLGLAIEKMKDRYIAKGKSFAPVYQTKAFAKYAEEAKKLQSMKKPGTLLGAAKGIAGGIRSGAAGIAGKGSALYQIYKERKEIKASMGLEAALRKNNTRKALAAQKAITAKWPDNEKRARRIMDLDARSARAKKAEVGIAKRLTEYKKERQAIATSELAVEKAYDKLYSVRQQLKTTPHVIKGKGGQAQASMTYRTLKAEETRLADFINKNQAANAFKKGHIEAKISKATIARQHAIDYQKTLANRKKVQVAQIASSKRIAAIDAKNERIKIARRVTKANSLSMARTTRGADTLRKTSYMKTLFSGMKLPSLGTTAIKGAMGLFQLARGFLSLTAGIAKFLFSWNGVGLAFNFLLLFGDKIKPIRDMFINFGQGIGAAFGELGKIGTYAEPAIRLFRLAYEAFVTGDSQVGIQAVVTGFQGLVSIIQNQLVAAWNVFAAKVGYIWLVIQQIGTAIMNVVKSLVSGIVQSFTVLAGPLMDGLQSLTGGGGSFGETVLGWIKTIATTLDWFITWFFKGVITLSEWGQKFLNGITATFGNIINSLQFALWGSKGGGDNLVGMAKINSQIAEARAETGRTQLDIENKQRTKEIDKIFAVTAQKLAAANMVKAQNANFKSEGVATELKTAFDQLLFQFGINNRQRTAELQAQQRAAAAMSGDSRPSSPTSTTPPEIQQFRAGLAALVGSIQQVRGNIIRFEEPKLIDETKKQTEILMSIDDRLARGGTFH